MVKPLIYFALKNVLDLFAGKTGKESCQGVVQRFSTLAKTREYPCSSASAQVDLGGMATQLHSNIASRVTNTCKVWTTFALQWLLRKTGKGGWVTKIDLLE